MLTWNDTPRKDRTGKVLSVSYTAHIPHWGEAKIHPHIHYPGEMFLDCPGLGIEMYSLGRVTAEDTLSFEEAGTTKANLALFARFAFCSINWPMQFLKFRNSPLDQLLNFLVLCAPFIFSDIRNFVQEGS